MIIPSLVFSQHLKGFRYIKRGFSVIRVNAPYICISVPEMWAFWASKKLVTCLNGIMVAQTFCDIFFMKKRHQISIYKQCSD
jgi:hypothetical protein